MPISNLSMPTLLSGQKLNEATNVAEAKAFPIGMNSNVAIFDKNDNVFYIKSTDAYGNTISFHKYRYTEEEDVPPLDNRYVTTEQFDQFRKEIADGQRSIQQSLDRLTSANRNAESAKQRRTDNGNDTKHNAAAQSG